ncbi:hypothetical protein [Aliivibrio fischeri]|uniref:hypothetical protein n=1 Tax=Aliivibrio fischeri TaxID=668 RepID=UPI0020B3A3B8|nr:hypothetical protein [Aliivibrio fischeri]
MFTLRNGHIHFFISGDIVNPIALNEPEKYPMSAYIQFPKETFNKTAPIAYGEDKQ